MTSRRQWLPLLVGGALIVRLVFVYGFGGDWAVLEQGPILCPFRSVTGMPCPGCGMTRATVACLMGAWGRAWDYHPLAVPLLGMAMLSALRPWLNPAWAAGLTRSWRQHRPWLVTVALLATAGSWLGRLAG